MQHKWEGHRRQPASQVGKNRDVLLEDVRHLTQVSIGAVPWLFVACSVVFPGIRRIFPKKLYITDTNRWQLNIYILNDTYKNIKVNISCSKKKSGFQLPQELCFNFFPHTDRLLSSWPATQLSIISQSLPSVLWLFVIVSLCGGEKKKKNVDIILWIIKGARANLFNELRRVQWGVFQ